MMKSIVFALLFTSSVVSAFAVHLSPNSGIRTLKRNTDVKGNAYEKRTLAQVKTDITSFIKKIEVLRDAANDFPSTRPSPGQVIAFQADLDAVVRASNTASRHIEALRSLSLADSRPILDGLEKLVPGVASAMDAFIAKKAAIDSILLVGTPVTHEDLENLLEALTRLYDALFNAIPAELSERLSRLSKAVLQIVQRAIDAYS
ncbi:hypothetical protein ONZ45_g8748 [Pleurotus djamor]|nr:hypothetical protein ONZ45_g8748 [Pleurotus djamor]